MVAQTNRTKMRYIRWFTLLQQWRVIKVVHIAETVEGQHGELVLSVDALTKTVYMICLATPRFHMHSILLVHI